MFKDVMLRQEAWSISKQGCSQVAAAGGLLGAETVGDLCLVIQVTSFSLTLWKEVVSCPLGCGICFILCFIWVLDHQRVMLLTVSDRTIILIQLGLRSFLGCGTFSAKARPALGSTRPPYPIFCIDPSRADGKIIPHLKAASVFHVICSPHKNSGVEKAD